MAGSVGHLLESEEMSFLSEFSLWGLNWRRHHGPGIDSQTILNLFSGA